MGKKGNNRNSNKTPKRSKTSKSMKNVWKKRKAAIIATPVTGLLPVASTLFAQPSTSQAAGNAIVISSDSLSDTATYYGSSLSSFESAGKLLHSNPAWIKTTYSANHPQKTMIEVGTIPSEEYDSIMDHKLCIENEARKEIISGNRIVEIEYLLNTILQVQFDHLKICTLGKLQVKEEINRGLGLVSCIVLQCMSCEKLHKVFTENQRRKESVINTGAVWGALAVGSTYSHLSEILSCIDIPKMPNQMFIDMENKLGKEWKASLWVSMENAGKVEKEQALSMGNICTDGTPWITVYLDGSWSKRSYGHAYDAFSGMVGIIGKHTGELLFIGVRNRFCSICQRADNIGITSKDHVCFKNWNKSAPAMESDLVVEGFSLSEEMHGVRYCKFIADGDASTHAKIREHVVYGNDVKKIECTNHVLKNYGKHLHKLKKDTHINLEGRKLLSLHALKHLTKRAKTSIYEHAKCDQQNVSLLKIDLKNGILHVFGEHTNCREGTCNTIGDTSQSKMEALRRTTMFNHISGAMDLLIRKAHLLLENENNNTAERLMNIVARFNMGKRLNLIQRGSYERRSYLAGLRHNKKKNWHYDSWKNSTGQSPGKHFKKFMKDETNKTSHSNINKAKRKLLAKPKIISKRSKNTDYGPEAEQPEEDTSNMTEECERILEQLQVNNSSIIEIANDTVGQFTNDKYITLKKNRLTASNFGNIIRRRAHTPCHNLVVKCLGKSYVSTKATEYGIARESVAIRIYEEQSNLKVEPTGLWLDETYNYLGASPDGLINDNIVVEVKCLYSLSNTQDKDIKALLKSHKKKTCLVIRDDIVQLNRNHPYYYQIQGQLNITKREKCIFIVYVNDSIPLHVEEIFKDEDMWQMEMVPKLCRFYMECILPEIYLNKIGRKLKCVDPDFILNAIKINESKIAKQRKKGTKI